MISSIHGPLVKSKWLCSRSYTWVLLVGGICAPCFILFWSWGENYEMKIIIYLCQNYQITKWKLLNKLQFCLTNAGVVDRAGSSGVCLWQSRSGSVICYLLDVVSTPRKKNTFLLCKPEFWRQNFGYKIWRKFQKFSQPEVQFSSIFFQSEEIPWDGFKVLVWT